VITIIALETKEELGRDISKLQDEEANTAPYIESRGFT
jgi:hypothetical protein